jgi:transposase
LIQRRNLKRKLLDIENSIHHSLKVFGLRFDRGGRSGFEITVCKAVKGDQLTEGLIDCMLRARAALWAE